MSNAVLYQFQTKPFEKGMRFLSWHEKNNLNQIKIKTFYFKIKNYVHRTFTHSQPVSLVGFNCIGFSNYICFLGWLRKSNWRKRDNLIGLLLTIFLDTQLLVGMVLYVFVSPITKSAFANFGAAMKNADLRFYAIEHISIMVIALILIHIGRAKSKKPTIPWRKHRTSAIFYSLGFVLILAAIPWERALM